MQGNTRSGLGKREEGGRRACLFGDLGSQLRLGKREKGKADINTWDNRNKNKKKKKSAVLKALTLLLTVVIVNVLGTVILSCEGRGKRFQVVNVAINSGLPPWVGLGVQCERGLSHRPGQ